MDDDWTSHLREYVDRLHRADLIPPIGSVQLSRREGRDILIVIVYDVASDQLRSRIHDVLAPIPYEIEIEPLAHDGRRGGVDYG